jgi:hypothetical protein
VNVSCNGLGAEHREHNKTTYFYQREELYCIRARLKVPKNIVAQLASSTDRIINRPRHQQTASSTDRVINRPRQKLN